MSQSYCVVLCTCPNRELAERIANVLVVESLAACVNILPGITSVYRWQGSVHSDAELLLLIKTRGDCYRPLESRIHELHSYTVPEIIALPILQGHGAYLHWIDSSLGKLSSYPSDHGGEAGEDKG